MNLVPVPGSILDSKHSHTCTHCGHAWMCYDEEWATLDHTKCGVTKSAKSNHSGPFCLLCYHVLMAGRHAAHRGHPLTALLFDASEQLKFDAQ